MKSFSRPLQWTLSSLYHGIKNYTICVYSDKISKSKFRHWKSWKLKYCRCWPKSLETLVAFPSAHLSLDFIIKLWLSFQAKAWFLLSYHLIHASVLCQWAMYHSTTFTMVRDPCFNKQLTRRSIKARGTSRFTNFHLYFSHCWKGSWKCSACSDSTQTALRWQECSRNKIQLHGADLCPYRIWWVFRRGCFPRRFTCLNLVLPFSLNTEHVQTYSETGSLFTVNVHRRVQFAMMLYL